MTDGRDTSRAGLTPEQAFGVVLQRLRHERRWSQEQLGFESGYHRTYISLLERGLKSPSLATVFHLATALQVAPAEVVRRTEEQVGHVPQRRARRDGSG